ncbi:hypothetical protein B296_00023966 [Ensete ventricosum]|uniref:EF-hand domain-containing protein n=1 Tax=Ensete ventricosum TaxID=4639 RepID=A0A426ZCA6_ENSVE|nr:hypothetical protein B296_00023966 [Ensete ventricosum]
MQRLLKMVDGLNFKEFVAFLSAFSPLATVPQKIELIFKVYDVDGKGRVTFKDLMEVLGDLTGSEELLPTCPCSAFIPERPRVLVKAPYPAWWKHLMRVTCWLVPPGASYGADC